MRCSEGALAVISQTNMFGDVEYLAQWNANWDGYSLIGGHVETGETFREACLREIMEELECTETGIEVAHLPCVTLRFQQYSQAAKEETDYQWQVFVTQIPDEVRDGLPNNCQWITADHARSGHASDGKPITDQAWRVLEAVENIDQTDAQ